jgi:hypothetical protein
LTVLKCQIRAEQKEFIDANPQEARTTVLQYFTSDRNSSVQISNCGVILRFFLKTIIAMAKQERGNAEVQGKFLGGQVDFDYDEEERILKEAVKLEDNFEGPKTKGWAVIGFGAPGSLLSDLKEAYAYSKWTLEKQAIVLPAHFETFGKWWRTICQQNFTLLWRETDRLVKDKLEEEAAREEEKENPK